MTTIDQNFTVKFTGVFFY